MVCSVQSITRVPKGERASLLLPESSKRENFGDSGIQEQLSSGSRFPMRIERWSSGGADAAEASTRRPDTFKAVGGLRGRKPVCSDTNSIATE